MYVNPAVPVLGGGGVLAVTGFNVFLPLGIAAVLLTAGMFLVLKFRKPAERKSF